MALGILVVGFAIAMFGFFRTESDLKQFVAISSGLALTAVGIAIGLQSPY